MYNYIIQSVLIPTDKYNLKEGVKWLEEHKFKHNKVDNKSGNFMRFRQINPETLKKKGFTNYFTYKLKNGIEYIVSYSPKSV